MSGVKLSAKWQLDAALLSRPVDLTALVTMSRTVPENFLKDNVLHRLITLLLNEKNTNKSDKVHYQSIFLENMSRFDRRTQN